jgi:tetratricopeptide (TPR) repeat protein
MAGAPEPFDVAEAFKKGIAAFRDDRWREGYELLTKVAQHAEKHANMPGVFYSYLGLGIAHCEGRRRDGMELCRYALQLDPNNHESYLNIASVYLMLGRREAAWRAVGHGLKLRPGHVRLLELQRKIGVRRRLTFPALARTNPLNSLSGRLRAALGRRRERRRERAAEIAQFGR